MRAVFHVGRGGPWCIKATLDLQASGTSTLYLEFPRLEKKTRYDITDWKVSQVVNAVEIFRTECVRQVRANNPSALEPKA